MKFTDDDKNDISERLALWLSASMDQQTASEEMRKHILAWLNFQDSTEWRREVTK